MISTELAKQHLRITHHYEDDLISLYIEGALNSVKNYLNDSDPPEVAAIKAAILLIVSDLYDNRSSSSEKPINENPAVDRLLFPYRKDLGI